MVTQTIAASLRIDFEDFGPFGDRVNGAGREAEVTGDAGFIDRIGHGLTGFLGKLAAGDGCSAEAGQPQQGQDTV